MADNPYDQGGMSVTIKGDEPGGKYNDAKSPGTWLVFHGTPERIREQIKSTFDLSDEDASGPLFDVVNQATKLFKASGNVTTNLGGTVLRPGTSNDSSDGAPPWNRDGDAGKSQPDPDAEVNRLLAAIEATKTVTEVQELWARNQEAFKDARLMEAYKAKGSAHKAAGAL